MKTKTRSSNPGSSSDPESGAWDSPENRHPDAGDGPASSSGLQDAAADPPSIEEGPAARGLDPGFDGSAEEREASSPPMSPPVTESAASGAYSTGGSGYRPSEIPLVPVPFYELQRTEDSRISLLQHIVRAIQANPKGHRSQRNFLRCLRRLGSDDRMIDEVCKFRDAVILASLQARKSGGGIILGLTGPKGGEGTSVLSLLLSLALGDCANRRVAFLDGHFDVDRFQTLAGLIGLSENCVRFHKGLSEVVGFFNDRFSNSYFLTSFKPERSMEFFSDRRLSVFLRDLRHLFDFTVIDLPPLLKDAAGIFVLPHLDFMYLVAEAGKTKLADVDRCVEAATKANSLLSGVVINKQRTPSWSRFFWKEFFF